MRPYLREQFEVNSIDSFGILSEQTVNRRTVGHGGSGVSLATGISGKEAR
jgi:hypothetical protein